MSMLQQFVVYGSLVVQIGLLMVVAVYIGFRAGWWLDELRGGGMLFTILGAVLGVAAGFTSVYRLVMNALNSMPMGNGDSGKE